MADRKKAVVPYNTEKDPKKKEILKQILIKLTQQIKGYEKNLIDLRDMEEKYIQQMQADAELDVSAFD
jgi:HEPN domain-containing protein